MLTAVDNVFCWCPSSFWSVWVTQVCLWFCVCVGGCVCVCVHVCVHVCVCTVCPSQRAGSGPAVQAVSLPHHRPHAQPHTAYHRKWLTLDTESWNVDTFTTEFNHPEVTVHTGVKIQLLTLKPLIWVDFISQFLLFLGSLVLKWDYKELHYMTELVKNLVWWSSVSAFMFAVVLSGWHIPWSASQSCAYPGFCPVPYHRGSGIVSVAFGPIVACRIILLM